MPGLRNIIYLLAAAGIALLPACSRTPQGNRRLRVQNDFLVNSFPLRQGEFSAITCLAADSRGNVYAAGYSDLDCVVLKLDAELGTLLEMVRFGSARDYGYSSQDTIKDIAVDSKGCIFVAGYTQEIDFPVTRGCFDGTMAFGSFDENYEGFVTKFSPDLKMLASTFIGGGSEDKALALAIDPHDDVFVTGYTCSGSPHFFPTTENAYDRIPPPSYQSKMFVARLSNDLSTLKAATLLGGNREKHDSENCAYDIHIDTEGNVWVAGQTQSDDFPVTSGCIDNNLSGESDAFVSKLDTNLERLLASTYVGGSRNERANAIVTDRQGHVYVGGWSESPDFPMVKRGYDTTHSLNEEDAFVVKLDSDLQEMQSATFLGGEGPPGRDGFDHGDDRLSCMALSDDGKTLFVAGRTESRDFDTSPPSRKSHAGNIDFNIHLDRSKNDKDYGDGFLALFDNQLSRCLYSTTLGGTSLDYIDDILINGRDVLLAGETASEDFPLMPINYEISGTRGFISRIDAASCKKIASKKPQKFDPQFSDTEIRHIAKEIFKDTWRHYKENKVYDLLGSYAKERISRKALEAAIRREHYLYGTPFHTEMFRYYNYFQNGRDGYDWIELCYADAGNNLRRHNGRIVATIIAKKKKWQLVDVAYRGFSTESGHMARRLY
jgi:hypothetical protein